MILNEPLYLRNESYVKLYGTVERGFKIKIVNMKCVRNSMVEYDDLPLSVKKNSVNNCKLDNNISRAKSVIFEYAFCNNWDYFFTGTLDRKKYDRSNLDKFRKDFTQLIRDLRKKYDCDIKYLFIPELHKDGKSWHLHGFLSGIPEFELVPFSIGDRMGKYIADKVQNGQVVYNWLSYSKKFGFCDIERINNFEAVCKYVTKYITKDLASSVTELGAHLYYCSNGLNKAETIKKGCMSACNIQPDFEGDYCSISWVDYSTDTLDYINSCFV